MLDLFNLIDSLWDDIYGTDLEIDIFEIKVYPGLKNHVMKKSDFFHCRILNREEPGRTGENWEDRKRLPENALYYIIFLKE